MVGRATPILAALLASGLAVASAWAEPTSHPNPHGGSDVTCATCHDDAHAGVVGSDCASCHTAEAWRPTLFDVLRHASTDFPLEGKHTEAACSSCPVESVCMSAWLKAIASRRTSGYASGASFSLR